MKWTYEIHTCVLGIYILSKWRKASLKKVQLERESNPWPHIFSIHGYITNSQLTRSQLAWSLSWLDRCRYRRGRGCDSRSRLNFFFWACFSQMLKLSTLLRWSFICLKYLPSCRIRDYVICCKPENCFSFIHNIATNCNKMSHGTNSSLYLSMPQSVACCLYHVTASCKGLLIVKSKSIKVRMCYVAESPCPFFLTGWAFLDDAKDMFCLINIVEPRYNHLLGIMINML